MRLQRRRIVKATATVAAAKKQKLRFARQRIASTANIAAISKNDLSSEEKLKESEHFPDSRSTSGSPSRMTDKNLTGSRESCKEFG